MGFLQSHDRHCGGDGQARLIATRPFSKSLQMPIFRNLDDAEVKGKRVLVRVDLNVPMQDGKVADSSRIEEIVPTIAELTGKGGKVILLSHFGRPKGPDPKYSLRPVAAELARLIKLELLGNLLTKVETLIIGGAMANTFLVAQGKRVGKSLVETELVGAAHEILSRARMLRREIVLPVDAVVAAELAAHAPSHVVSVDDVGADVMILDIGPRTIEHVISVLARSKTLVWNGPFGAFEHEPFDNGTIEVAEAVAELTATGKLVSFAGGGDTVAALNVASVKERMTHVSTGGGAFLESLEGKMLPGVKVLIVQQTSAVAEE